jgi:predicted MPP superfamily phosphohydrolase
MTTFMMSARWRMLCRIMASPCSTITVVVCDFKITQLISLEYPDAHVTSAETYSLLTGLSPDKPTIVLVHDPVWFAHLPAGPHLMLAGHTHGGQIRLPGIGIVRNATKAPLRWSHGLIEESGQYLYVTSGIGTSGLPVRWGVPPEFAVLDMLGKL